jgi:monofunctional biosynthetic peptidoglycan transglycosylase
MRRKKRSFGLATIALLALIALFLLPVAEVCYVRMFNPPVSTLMLIRNIEALFSREYRGGTDYRWIPLEQVPDDFLNAVWQMEDSRFFDHDGFDWIEVEEAIERARVRNEPVRGVSTITMQCARSMFLWQGRSWPRKGIEVYYTFLMERLLPKRRILELYINVIELGDGIYGIEAAAQRYYRVPATRLTRSQAAMLAAMLPYPRGWNPLNPTPRLRARYSIVLRRMNQGGSIERKLLER